MSTFLKQMFSNPFSTGGIAPCGPQIVKIVTDHAGLDEARSVVELGPGTGVFTEEILKKTLPDTVFFGLEINHEFVEATRKRCPEALIYEDSAENLLEYTARHNLTEVDCIISTLPWTIFPKELRERILNVVYAALKPGGVFLTVSYSHMKNLPSGIKFSKQLKHTFSGVTPTKGVWDGPLPMFAYHCVK